MCGSAWTPAIDTRNGLIPGRVIRIDPAAQNGTVRWMSSFGGPLPEGARPELSVDGTIEMERLQRRSSMWTARCRASPIAPSGFLKSIPTARALTA